MDVTVAVCTHRQYDGLARTVASLLEQTYSSTSYRILVVDNDPLSTTSCAQALAPFMTARQIDVVVEERLGVSQARNRALAESETELLVFIDDDCVAEPPWLENLVNGYRGAPTPVGAIGGRILPDWEAPAPPWLTGHLTAYLSLFDLGPEVVHNPRRLVGCNIAYSVKALRSINGFRPYLGRVGTCLLSNEEVDVVSKFRRMGLNNSYEPSAVVRHRVPLSRVDRQWFRKRVFWQAVSDALLRTDRPNASRGRSQHQETSSPFISKLMEPVTSYEEFDNQLAAIYRLATQLAENPEDAGSGTRVSSEITRQRRRGRF